MKISAILKGRKDDKERLPVVIRINNGHQRTFKTLKIKVTENQWEESKVVRHPQASIYNDIIKKEIAKWELSEIKDIQKVKKVDLFNYWDQCIELWRTTKTKGDDTLKQYKYEKSKLQRFKTSFYLTDIDRQFFIDLLRFCYEKCGNCENTAWKTFSRVHAVLEQAIVDKLLQRNPMKDFKKERPKYEDPEKGFLTKEQLSDVERFAHTVDSKEQRFATLWFLIGCYTGMRYSDMKTFDKKKHIIGDRLIKKIKKKAKKNKPETISLPFTGKIKELIELVEYKPLNVQNQPYNRMLKTIADRCGIELNMTAHSSRHTAGMSLANAKVDIDTIAKVLGHSSTKHTQIYAKIANATIDEAMDKIIK